MKKVVVCGSIAYDHIMDFPGWFKDQILPDKIESLNVSFLVNGLKKLRGGTAPNIAYSLALVGECPYILGTAGKDFTEYQSWLEENGVHTDFVRVLEDDYTASCFITTDRSSNQITSFYPGAMSRDIELSIKDLRLDEIGMVLIAPTVPEAMLKLARECKEYGIPYMFDPGMQIPRLTGEELREGIMGSAIAIFNEYEYNLMLTRTGMAPRDILKYVKILIVTLGEKGSVLYSGDREAMVGPAKPIRVVDPTGAGDAYRAGIIKGYFEGASLERMGQYGSITSVYAVEHKGATEHHYTLNEFYERLRENFG